MTRVKIEKNSNDIHYRVNGKRVTFKYCSLGPYTGKSFILFYNQSKTEDGYDSFSLDKMYEMKVIDSYEQANPFGRYHTVPVVVEFDENLPLDYVSVFYAVAKETNFTYHGASKNWKGYTFNTYWNGWAMPYFSKRTCISILNYSCGKAVDGKWTSNDKIYHYDKENDTFYETNADTGEIFPLGSVKTINGHKVYDLGSCNWCWYEYEEVS